MTDRGHSHSAPEGNDQWRYAITLLIQQIRRHTLLVLGLSLIAAIGAGAFALFLPPTYRATAELLMDPRGLQVFENELVAGQFDANAAVNYVESQIHVLLSSRVLSQALRDVNVENSSASVQTSGENAEAERKISATEIDKLRRNISVTRAERSYLLSVTTAGNSPQEAANLTNAIVQAYLDEESASRAAIAQRLTDELGSRLDLLRERLTESERRAEEHRQKNNLISADNTLIVEQRLAAAVTALDDADKALATMRVRHQQILAGDLATTVALAEEAEQIRLNLLVNRRIVAREELAQLATQLGSRHPTLRNTTNKVDELDELIRAESAQISQSSATALAQMQQERDNLEKVVQQLMQENSASRESLIELRALEAEIASNRQLLSSFETRSREIAEFARIDSANVRVLSNASPPEIKRGIFKIVILACVGGIIGGMIGLGWAVLQTAIKYPSRYRAALANSADPTEISGPVPSLLNLASSAPSSAAQSKDDGWPYARRTSTYSG